MGTKLNPDGIKIRALRIQRGWTQEQLAEIADISLRTVQRTESANGTSFETMKAIAAAFETDFDRLLKHESDRASTRETQPIISAEESCSDPAPEQIVSKQAELKVRRIWPTQMIALSALIVGLGIGIAVTSHLNKHSLSPPTTSHSVVKALPNVQKSFSETQFQNKSPRTLSIPKAVPDTVIEAASSNLEIIDDDKDYSLPAADIPTNRPVNVLETAPLELIQPLSSRDLEPLKIIPMPLVVSYESITETALSDTSGSSIQEEQASGAVRQAVDLAVKKTGGFFSKARESIKRAF